MLAQPSNPAPGPGTRERIAATALLASAVAATVLMIAAFVAAVITMYFPQRLGLNLGDRYRTILVGNGAIVFTIIRDWDGHTPGSLAREVQIGFSQVVAALALLAGVLWLARIGTHGLRRLLLPNGLRLRSLLKIALTTCFLVTAHEILRTYDAGARNFAGIGGRVTPFLATPRPPRFLLWLPPAVFGALALPLWIADRRARLPHECPRCRYDLTGNVSGVCPECGAPLDDQTREIVLRKAT